MRRLHHFFIKYKTYILDRLNKQILVTLLFIISSISWAQKSMTNQEKNALTNNNETLFVHTNSNTLVCGETLFYKMYCLNTTNLTKSSLSKIGYIELIDASNKTIFKQKVFLQNSAGQGEIFIPTTALTGSYKIIAYTNLMLNKTKNTFFEQDIYVINPFENTLNKELTDLAVQKNDSTIQNQLKSIGKSSVLALNKDKFSERELVTLKFKNPEAAAEGNYSISVRKIDNLPSPTAKQSTTFQEKNTEVSLQKEFQFIPELRGELLSGKIIAKKEGVRINDISVALYVPGNSAALKIVKSDSNGSFTFTLEKSYPATNIIVQIIDGDKSLLGLKIDEFDVLNNAKFNFASTFKLNKNHIPDIENRATASQIENAYYNKKKDEIVPSVVTEPFYSPNHKTYKLNDYTRFPSVKETITEVLKELYYSEKNKQYTIFVSDYDVNSKVNEPAMILVDGLLIQNINEVFDINPETIKQVDVVSGGYSYGESIYNGVVNFITFKNTFETKLTGDYIVKMNTLRPLPNKNYYSPKYLSATDNSRTPDYRYQLAWFYNIQNLDTKEYTFYTSDVHGVFEISLEGFSKSGTPLSAKTYFEVD